MDIQKVDMYIMQNQKFFPTERIPQIRDMLIQLPEDKFVFLSSAEMKDPTIHLIISLLLGGWGIDRFLIGDIGMGVLKLLTGGGCGILAIIDWFSIQNKTKEYNFTSFMNAYTMLTGMGGYSGFNQQPPQGFGN